MITPLDPDAAIAARRGRTAAASRSTSPSTGDVWRFGRTPITAPGPFSDYTGFDRLQVLVAGRGLVLQTPDGEIDVRAPFQPVRFAGETPIVSRLEAGPVEVVNLIGERAGSAIDLARAGGRAVAAPGRRACTSPIVRRPAQSCGCDGRDHVLADHGGVRIDDAGRRCGLRRGADRVGERDMRIAVVGAGGVGGGFGAALAKAGADVTFIARGAHLAAMKSQGLKVESPRGDTHLVPTQATDDPTTVGPVDIVLFCVKLWDVESAGEHDQADGRAKTPR